MATLQITHKDNLHLTYLPNLLHQQNQSKLHHYCNLKLQMSLAHVMKCMITQMMKIIIRKAVMQQRRLVYLHFVMVVLVVEVISMLTIADLSMVHGSILVIMLTAMMLMERMVCKTKFLLKISSIDVFLMSSILVDVMRRKRWLRLIVQTICPCKRLLSLLVCPTAMARAHCSHFSVLPEVIPHIIATYVVIIS